MAFNIIVQVVLVNSRKVVLVDSRKVVLVDSQQRWVPPTSGPDIFRQSQTQSPTKPGKARQTGPVENVGPAYGGDLYWRKYGMYNGQNTVIIMLVDTLKL